MVIFLKSEGYSVKPPLEESDNVNFEFSDSARKVLSKFGLKPMTINALYVGIMNKHNVSISDISIKEFVNLYDQDIMESHRGHKYHYWIRFRQFGNKSYNDLKQIISEIKSYSNK